MRRLVFVDFEASALRDGYPIEVGWAWAENAHVEARSMLIARADESQSPGYQWDPMAEAIHGLTLEQVDRQGQLVDRICRALNDSLSDAELCFDTGPVGMDRRWLMQLYAESVVSCHLRFAPPPPTP